MELEVKIYFYIRTLRTSAGVFVPLKALFLVPFGITSGHEEEIEKTKVIIINTLNVNILWFSGSTIRDLVKSYEIL